MTVDAHPDTGRRKAELAANLAALRGRMQSACDAAARSIDELVVVAVTKTFPATDVRLLAGLGIRDIGENRDQEAAPKAAVCADLPLSWHFVGQLQSNKARSVAGYADVVQSVDRARLVRVLDAAAGATSRRLGCFIQVSLDPPGGAGRPPKPRGGAEPGEVSALAAAIASAEHLDLCGVMAVAPIGADPRPAFEHVVEISANLVREHPTAGAISAGMSGDFEAAILAGATHLRVGALLLGRRPPAR